MAADSAADKNKLEFIRDAPSLSYTHSNSVGKVFAQPSARLPFLSGRIGFVVREGVDPIEGISTGRVVESNAGAGVCGFKWGPFYGQPGL